VTAVPLLRDTETTANGVVLPVMVGVRTINNAPFVGAVMVNVGGVVSTVKFVVAMEVLLPGAGVVARMV